jgi:hypothetical protein
MQIYTVGRKKQKEDVGNAVRMAQVWTHIKKKGHPMGCPYMHHATIYSTCKTSLKAFLKVSLGSAPIAICG